MPKIVAIATAVPEFKVDQATVCEIVSNHFSGRLDELKRLLPIFSNAGITTRYFCRPIDWMVQPHSLEERNRTYIECATDLSAAATFKLIEQNEMSPQDFDYIIYVNTTGLSTPSIDARLINKLSLRRDIHRTPVWGLGCAGGAAGLSHAYRYLLGHPEGKVLLIATELCGLTFLADDYSKSNLVATASYIASWDSTSWSALGSGTNASSQGLTTVSALSVYDNKLITGGRIDTAGGVTVNRIASWDGSTWSALGSGMNNIVSALTVYDSKLTVGGVFTVAGSKVSAYIAQWTKVSFICGDVNNDGTPSTVLDLTYLIDDIFRGGPAAAFPQSADLNGDGTPATVLDLTFMVDEIFRGGPAPTCGL